MIMIRILLATLAFAALDAGFSLAAAQDNPPIVPSEVIRSSPTPGDPGSQPEPASDSCSQTDSQVSDSSDASFASRLPVTELIAASASAPTVNIWNKFLRAQSTSVEMPDKCDSNASASCGNLSPTADASINDPMREMFTVPPIIDAAKIKSQTLQPKVLQSASIAVAESTSKTNATAQPAALSDSDTRLFSHPTASAELPDPTEWEIDPTPANASSAPMPRMTKMFSFSTIDKVAKVATAVGQFESELTLHMASPDSVGVNQVFQQLVQVCNSGDSPQRDVRVTQVCDLSVLGADQHQAVVIDCLEPGETKTVRFSARALRAGEFAVRYVAENSIAQADVGDVISVAETGLLIDIVGPSQMFAGDAGDVKIAIHNSTSNDVADLQVRCTISPEQRIEFLNGEVADDFGNGCRVLRIPQLKAQTTETVQLRFASIQSGRLKLEVDVESPQAKYANKVLPISVIARPR